VLGIVTGLPDFSSYMDRSTAAPRLCFDPREGSATNSCLSAGVASQKIRVTYQGRYASWIIAVGT
jgi:hypothetical protein